MSHRARIPFRARFMEMGLPRELRKRSHVLSFEDCVLRQCCQSTELDVEFLASGALANGGRVVHRAASNRRARPNGTALPRIKGEEMHETRRARRGFYLFITRSARSRLSIIGRRHRILCERGHRDLRSMVLDYSVKHAQP